MKKNLFLAIFLLAGAVLSYGQNMRKPVNVSNSAAYSRWGQVAMTQDGRVHIIWEENNYIIYISYDGKTFSAPLKLKSNPDVEADRPSISASKKGGIYVVWTEYGNIVLAEYNPVTKTWLDNVLVADSAYVVENPCVAADSEGNIYVDWDSSAGPGTVFSRSKINGVWEPVKQLSSGLRSKYASCVAGGDDVIWASWGEKQGNGEYKNNYRKRTKDTNWSDARMTNSSGADQDRPYLTMGPDNIPWVIYGDVDMSTGNAAEIWICKIDEGGNPREIVVPLNLQHYPRMCIDKNGAKHVAVQIGPGDFGAGIIYTNSIGGQFKTPTIMANSAGWPKLPGIATDGQNVALVWGSQSEGNKEIWLSTLYPVTLNIVYAPINLGTSFVVESQQPPKITYTLTWKHDPKNEKGAVSAYKIFHRKILAGEFALLTTLSGTATSYTVSLDGFYKYTAFGISAVGASGMETEMKEFSISRPSVKDPIQPEISVSLKKFTGTPEITYNLSWAANPENSTPYIRAYRIYKKEGSGEYALFQALSNSTFSASYTVASSGLRIWFAVSAISVFGEQSGLVPFGVEASQRTR